MAKIVVRQTASPIRRAKDQRATLIGLGLNRVGRTSTLGRTQATEPYVAMLVQKGVERALAEHKGLARGVNTRGGKNTYEAVAKALGYS